MGIENPRPRARGFAVASLLALLLAAFSSGGRDARADSKLQGELKDVEVGKNWIYDDWPAARAHAAQEGKPIFALFR